ncbi:MAG: hypothetical protein MR707_06215, partial [Galactobacillus timonensis]
MTAAKNTSNSAMKPESHGRRILAYVVLIFLTVLCLIWFYILFINATRSNGDLSRGFRAYPSNHLGENLYNLFHGTLPVGRG